MNEELKIAQIPSDIHGLNIRPPLDPGNVRHECSYCGGWDENTEDRRWDDKIKTLRLAFEKEKLERIICIKCWIKCFDKILGEPLF